MKIAKLNSVDRMKLQVILFKNLLIEIKKIYIKIFFVILNKFLICTIIYTFNSSLLSI